MRYLIPGSLALFIACVLLGAGQAPAGDAPQAPAAPAEAKPGTPVRAAVDGAQPSPSYTDHELTDAEKVALAKHRMERCRMHPGTCTQGAKNSRDGKVKPEPVGPSKPPLESAQK